MASFFSELLSIPTILSTCASLVAAIVLFRTTLSAMLPPRIQDYIFSQLSELLSDYFSRKFTFIVEEKRQAATNQTFRAVELYLPTIIRTSADGLVIDSDSLAPYNLDLRLPAHCKAIDKFEGMKLKWYRVDDPKSKEHHPDMVRYSYHLKCKRSDREKVMRNYLPHIANKAQTILDEREKLLIYTHDMKNMGGWKSKVFKHPATFATLAMEAKRKAEIIKDLETFVQRKDFFQRVGRTCKRGYFLHGPPGTGKSTLVAAIANKLRYNIYDLQLQSVLSDAELRRILTSITDRSILLVEDIDCSTKASRDRTKIRDEQEGRGQDELDHRPLSSDPGITLSGLLNLTDGLWSSFGEERLIIFTANDKEELDPALLRPGRMDYEIDMGCCTFSVFKQLTKSYLQIDYHHLFDDIKNLLKDVNVTPTKVGQQPTMKGDDIENLLKHIENLLKDVDVTPAEVGQQLMMKVDDIENLLKDVDGTPAEVGQQLMMKGDQLMRRDQLLQDILGSFIEFLEDLQKKKKNSLGEREIKE